ncbi:MAG: ABC transporter [Firmicutes bacterium HGW-Firmicutes-1]|jgi:ATP-binding cassette subfamily F protein 3|nr:MAG: ABC transporter [Firmicutes bacterium HGW-Firmicutes-1]
MILSGNNLAKAFITDVLFKDVSFQINEKEKVAVVGINGAGKSTLFKIITKELLPDTGNVVISNQTTVGYLSQNSTLDSDKSIYEEILSAKANILEMEDELLNVEKEIATHAKNEEIFEQLSTKYMNLRHEFEMLDGYSYKSRVKGILKGLGFCEEEFDKMASVLSGGQKTRLALAKILVSQPELLLLDEPTNHLDINATEWLENYLTTYNGTLLIISHDRYFLDKIVSKVIELEAGKCKTYMGNYSFYAKHKAINEEIEEKHYETQQKDIKKQEEVIKQLRSFNREKSIKRARSREKALDKVERLDKPQALNDTMKFTLKPKHESGNDVLSVQDLKMSFSSQQIFENVSFDLLKGEKIALIGKNGSGKTTIFKILTDHIQPTNGRVKLGANVHVGYYDQEHSLLNPQNNLIDEISDTYPTMNVGDIRNVLAAFLFTKDDVFKQITSLSGGEKGRLTLAKLMLSQSNLLLLDEPTNHLDVVSREVLESTLNKYTGTLFFISHDRYFINQVATRILDLSFEGIKSYSGNYDYYIEKRSEEINSSELHEEPDNSKTKTNKALWLQNKELETQKRKKEKLIEKTELEIHEVEDKMKEIDLLLCQDEIYTDHLKVQELSDQKTNLEDELSDLYQLWDTLHED